MFDLVVDLYRKLNLPPIPGGSFSFEGNVAPEVIQLLHSMEELPDTYGVFQEKSINGNFIDIEFSIPGTNYGRFHNNIADFLRVTPQIESGDLPDQFYICDIDYYSHDISAPDSIKNLQSCCEFIKLLTELSSIEKTNTDPENSNRLVFVLVADGKTPPKTINFRTKIEVEALSYHIPHISFLREITSDKRRDKIHTEERRMILQMAIAEILSVADKNVNLLTYLIGQWGDVLRKYRHNFQAFLHEYSFEKVRKEIAAAEIEHATKLSSVLGDIAGKLLALPVSMGGILLLKNAKDDTEFAVIATGLIIVSIIFIGVLINQWLQVDRIKSSFNIIFSQYDDKLESFAENLRKPIKDAKRKIRRQSKVLTGTFIAFSTISFLPFLGVIYIYHLKYNCHFISAAIAACLLAANFILDLFNYTCSK